MADSRALERLANAEMDAPPPPLRLAVDEKPGNRIQLIAEVKADRPDWCLIPQPETGRVAQVAQVSVGKLRPDIPSVKKDDASDISGEPDARL